MKYFLFISVAGIFLSGCVSVGTVSLSEDNLFALGPQKSSKSSGVDLKKYNNGTIADFEKGSISQWSGSSKIILSQKNGNLVVNAVGVGQEYDRFNYSFLPLVDFSKTNILKVRVRAKGDRIPTLRIDLKDINGHVTNSRDAKARLILCDEYITYYFRYEGRFRQSWPVQASVDSKNIAQLELFINPGGSNFSGQLLIDEITPISEDNMWEEIERFVPPCDVSANMDFNENAKFAWTNSSLYSIEHENKALKITSRGAGSDYQSFGVGFSMSDLGDRPMLEIRAKLKGEEAAQLRVDLVDFSGNSTNGDIQEVTIPNDNVYRTYTFDYQDKLFQGWPTTEKVDEKYISELMFFMNPGGPGVKGELYIDDIKVVNNPKNPNWDLAEKYPLANLKTASLFNSSESDNTWWSSLGEPLILSKKGIIIPEMIQKNDFGTGTDVFRIDDNSLLKITAENLTQGLKIKLMDHRGVESEYGEMKLNGSGNEASMSLNELANSNKKLNPMMITGLVFKNDNTNGKDLIISNIQLIKNK